MTNQIVEVIVSQQAAPSPPTLQRTGAFVSQGGTTEEPGTTTLLTEVGDLADILTTPLPIATLSWSNGAVTVETENPHGFTFSSVLDITIAGAVPTEYNGTYRCTVIGSDTFLYDLGDDPGVETSPGTYVPANAAELVSMNTTFFAQGRQLAVYVLELGPGDAAAGVTALGDWIDDNSGEVYGFLVPRSWADESTFFDLTAAFVSTTSLTYFFATFTVDNYVDLTTAPKCVIGLIEAPDTPDAEFSSAADFWVALHYQPSSTNKVTPYAFSFLLGVTPYPTKGNGALLAALKAAGVNVVGTGAEGGISSDVLFWGTTMDLKDFTYWYSVDWVQINMDRSIANTIINGSNTPTNPLYYNQDGINRLQASAAGVMSRAVTYGLALGTIKQTQLTSAEFDAALDAGEFDGQAVINAQPFIAYSEANPDDYPIGKYSGLTIVYVPARGFTQIIVNLVVSNFVTQ